MQTAQHKKHTKLLQSLFLLKNPHGQRNSRVMWYFKRLLLVWQSSKIQGCWNSIADASKLDKDAGPVKHKGLITAVLCPLEREEPSKAI